MFGVDRMVSARDGTITLPVRVLVQANSSLVTLWGPPPVTMPIGLQPAPVTAEKQGNPSEMTVPLGCKCCFAQRDISVSRKPLTTFMSVAMGWPPAFSETAATKGFCWRSHDPFCPRDAHHPNTHRPIGRFRLRACRRPVLSSPA